MKKLLFFSLLVLLVLSCKTPKNSTKKIIPEKINTVSLNGEWQLQTLFGTDAKWAKAPFIIIDQQEKSFKGNTGCNSISGKVEISESYIAFDKNFISTKMACISNYEKAFLSALLKVNKYVLNKADLELLQNEIVLMKFKRN